MLQSPLKMARKKKRMRARSSIKTGRELPQPAEDGGKGRIDNQPLWEKKELSLSTARPLLGEGKRKRGGDGPSLPKKKKEGRGTFFFDTSTRNKGRLFQAAPSCGEKKKTKKRSKGGKKSKTIQKKKKHDQRPVWGGGEEALNVRRSGGRGVHRA